MRAILLFLAASALAILAAGLLAGPLGALALLIGSTLYLAAFVWFPRGAHSAFVRGDFARAARLFRVAGIVRLSAAARRRARLSASACHLGAGRWQQGLATASSLDERALSRAERAVWKNNRAYALARLETHATEAVALADEALLERPELPGFVHTRGIALLAAGRLEEAIAALEAVYVGDDISPALECERCFDLGRAWLDKGEDEYAFDYFSRAGQVAPSSVWAERARDELGKRDAAPRSPPTDGLL